MKLLQKWRDRAVFRHEHVTWKIWKMSSQLGPDFLQSLHFTHEQCSRRLSTQTCSRHRSLCSVQAEAECKVIILKHVFVYSTSTPASALITKSSLEIYVSVFSLCGAPFFILRYLFSFCLFLHFCICMQEMSSTSPAVFSHGGWPEKLQRKSGGSHSDIWVLTCCPFGECQILSGLQCM